MQDSIILLSVLVPLLAAPLCILVGRAGARYVATLAAWISFGCAVTALGSVRELGTLTGHVDPEYVLGAVFSSFCIGK